MRPAMYIRLKDSDLGIDRRIRVTKVVTYPFDDSFHRRRTEVTLSDFVAGSKIADIVGKLDRTERTMYSNFRRIGNVTNTSNIEINNNSEDLTWKSGVNPEGW